MTCREFTAWIVEYIEATLPNDACQQFEHHLSACTNCERYFQQYRHTIALGRAAWRDTPAPELAEDAIRRILAARRRE